MTKPDIHMDKEICGEWYSFNFFSCDMDGGVKTYVFSIQVRTLGEMRGVYEFIPLYRGIIVKSVDGVAVKPYLVVSEAKEVINASVMNEEFYPWRSLFKEVLRVGTEPGELQPLVKLPKKDRRNPNG